jgi:hypothetical protein
MDDLLVTCCGDDRLFVLAERMQRCFRRLGLTVNPAKCGVFGTEQPFTFPETGDVVPPVDGGNPYRYLGMRYSPDGAPVQPDTDAVLAAGKAIVESGLRPDQKSRALRSHLLPRLDWQLAVEPPGWKSFEGSIDGVPGSDRRLRELCKQILHLPRTATDAYIHCSARLSGAGFRSLKSRACVAKIANFFRLLAVEDAGIRTCAHHLLPLCAGRRDGQVNDVTAYISGASAVGAASTSSLVREVRKAGEVFGRSFDCLVRWKSLSPPCLSLLNPVDGSDLLVITDEKTVFRDLFGHTDQYYHRRLLDAAGQGRYHRALAASRLASVAQRNLSFCDWRFIHKARLNLTPTNSTNPRALSKSCRRCGEEVESLSHVLNHCLPHRDRWMAKHNHAVQKLAEVARSKLPNATITTDRAVDDSGLRPDLVVVDEAKKRALVLDVKCPIDLADRFRTVKAEVTAKYECVRQALQRRGLEATVLTFIVGSLGSFPPSNFAAFKWLGASPKTYSSVGRALIRHNIHQSRNTWVEHATGVKQRY